MSGLRDRLISLAKLDRRVIYAVMFVAVATPLLVPISFAAQPGTQTRAFEQGMSRAIASPLPLLVDVDFGPQTMAELEPLLMAVLHRIFSAKKKVIFLTFQPEAVSPLRGYLHQMEAEYGLVYGRDYAFLGYASAFAYTIFGLGESFEAYFHEDDRGNELSSMPIMKNVSRLKDVSAVVNIASNAMPEFWIQYGVGPHGVALLAGTTAVQAAEYFPYLQTGQLKGILGGGRAAAEYETLLVKKGVLKNPGAATRGLGSQSLALLAILGFIAVGNIGFFLGRKTKKGQTP